MWVFHDMIILAAPVPDASEGAGANPGIGAANRAPFRSMAGDGARGGIRRGPSVPEASGGALATAGAACSPAEGAGAKAGAREDGADPFDPFDPK